MFISDDSTLVIMQDGAGPLYKIRVSTDSGEPIMEVGMGNEVKFFTDAPDRLKYATEQLCRLFIGENGEDA